MVLSLTLICLVCSALLGVVYSVTKAPIDAVEVAKVNDAIAAVTPAFDNVPSEEMFKVEESEVYPAKQGGEIVGYAIKVKSSGFGGALQMMVGFTADGTIYNTSIISHSETPGLGAKISDENIAPRALVKGRNPENTNLTVSKDGGDIDAITASTITSRAFLKGVNAAYEIFRQVVPATEGEPQDAVEETESETSNITEDEQ
ncbi:MAG: RnfABCDGE type electron transport complex subunit G [Bacteroidales bacterium]|nr:RnfABCDGE type electron transport complex subunit G [Candidatus Cacconaster merdequi]